MEKELSDIFFRYGEERWSRRIASNIVKARKVKPNKTSFELVRIVSDSIPKKFISKPQRIHPATRVFMALRIAVNQELRKVGIIFRHSSGSFKSRRKIMYFIFSFS
jgi:16S rRNA (cytosine1402-N4)-methyltransferase